MNESVIELRKQPVLNRNAVLSLILAGGMLAVALVLIGDDPAAYGLLAVVAILMPLVWRKFARSITVDFVEQSIQAVGVIPFFRQSFTFDELQYVRCPEAVGLLAAGTYVVVFRRRGAFQPLVFEVWSGAEKEQASRLLAALRAAMPEKMLDVALSPWPSRP